MKDTKNESTEVPDNENDLKDWVLAMIIRMVNSSQGGMTIGITVVSHGFLISGELVAGDGYFIGLGEEFKIGFSKAGIEVDEIQKKFIELGQSIYNKSDDSSTAKVSYIHLKDAKFFHPNGKPVPHNQGVFWRGRVSEISGFSLGKLTAEIN